MDEKLDYCFKIYNCKNMKDTENYLQNIKTNFSNLTKKGKKEYISLLQRIALTSIFDNMFKKEQPYYIYYSQKAIIRLVFNQFANLTLDNFDYIIDSLLDFFKTFNTKCNTKKITKKEIDYTFNIINKKIPNFQHILKNINLEIYILNNCNNLNNSSSIHSQNFKDFKILCYYLKDNDEYNNGITNPIYVFLHELGHVLCWYYTKESRTLPDSFIDFLEIPVNNDDALEVFADFFSIAIMYHTPLNDYNPFIKTISEEFLINIEKYFLNLINTIKEES